MKHIICITICIFSYLNLNAQWHQVNSNTTEDLYDIFFIDSLTGYCVGENGTFLKSSDGGENWDSIFSYPDVTFSEIKANDSVVVAIGARGYETFIMLGNTINNTFQIDSTTFDSPIHRFNLALTDTYFYFNASIYSLFRSTLDLQYLNLAQNTLAFDLTSDSTALCLINDYHSLLELDLLNGHIVDTVNNNLNLYSNDEFYFGINMISDEITYLSFTYYNPSTFKSENGGVSWQQIFLDPNLDFYFDAQNIAMLNDSVFISPSWVDNGKIYRYAVNTNEWTETYLGNFVLHGICNIGETAWVCGEDGTIFKTTNGGGTVSVNENEKREQRINIFPNPTSDILSIEKTSAFSEDLDWKLFNALGQQIKAASISAFETTRTISLADLPKGIYFYSLSYGEQLVKSGKLVVE